MQKTLTSPSVEVNLLKTDVSVAQVPRERPALKQPGGMTRERQRELYTTIRPYVRDMYKDVTCPPLED